MRSFRFVVVLGVLTIGPLSWAYAADNNLAFVDQIGADNTGLISQLGSANQVGTELDPVLQNGYYNDLTITQTGEDNVIGLEGLGVDQAGNSATPSIFNTILIDQDSNLNIVGSIQQSALGAIPEGANRLTIQQGLDGAGDRNKISLVVQEQLGGMPGQVAILTQTGEQNTVALVEQRSLTAAQFKENIIVANFSGSFNGRGDLTGPALTSRAVANSLIQRVGYDALGANGNEMNLMVSGDFNRFGVFQGGRKNSIGFLTISGNSNQIGFRQDGLENDITASEILGDGNNIGVGQIGTNRAFLNIVGLSSDNEVLGLQEGSNDLLFFVDGDGNDLRVEQGYNSGLGGGNDADVSVIGDSNFFDVTQFGTNSTTISVTGDFNNDPSQIFSGNAQLGLAAGTIEQVGTSNAATLSITGNRNMAAAQQNGDYNRISLGVVGDSNQAAFIQMGSMNVAWLLQSGNGNIAGFKQ
ncbi:MULTISPECIES: hypothetical protein [Falsihalocynthiibacter]|uniref:hypothetical protein n=1 Tax=Falsihalocynthiibacter TaxID=2854182 RepID=UPI00300244FA